MNPATICPLSHPPGLNVLTAAACNELSALHDFYRPLRRQALHFDAERQLYLVAAPALLRQALEHPDLGVRPPDQPLPSTLDGRHFGLVYSQWLRMREDPARAGERRALEQALASLSLECVQDQVRLQARQGLAQGWDAWQWSSLPASLAALLGLPMGSALAQGQLRQQLQSLALALRPDAGKRELDAADAACEALCQGLGSQGPAPLWRALQVQPLNAAAQALGLLWQSHEAGAALLGQALLAGPGSDTELLRHAQCPGAIQHTRRWTLRACELGGTALARGAALLLILASETPEQGAGLAFGHGRHQCPGQELALTLARGALREAAIARTEGWAPPLAPTASGHHALAHARVPRLGCPTELQT